MFNKQHLLGEVRGRPRTKKFPDGNQVTDFEMVTWDEFYLDNVLQRKEEIHTVTCRGKLSQIAYDLLSGDQLYVTGATRHRDGNTSVLADEIRIV